MATAEEGAVERDDPDSDVTVLTFNVLARSYLTSRSHPGLPPCHAAASFDQERRTDLLLRTLEGFCGPRPSLFSSSSSPPFSRFDVLCLQEVDPVDEVTDRLSEMGRAFSDPPMRREDSGTRPNSV